jgi:RNA polymerase sigma-70 factor, ECF subfamily
MPDQGLATRRFVIRSTLLCTRRCYLDRMASPVRSIREPASASWTELAAAAVGGDTAARDALLRELYAVVRKHVFFAIGSGPLADDAVQEAMVAIYRALPSFRGDAHPRTWALTIASHAAHRVRRREARHPTSDDTAIDTAVFDADPTAANELALLRRALARLTPRKRDAFVLMTLLELTAGEAGRALGTFANTAASRNRAARAELEQHLRDLERTR